MKHSNVITTELDQCFARLKTYSDGKPMALQIMSGYDNDGVYVPPMEVWLSAMGIYQLIELLEEAGYCTRSEMVAKVLEAKKC